MLAVRIETSSDSTIVCQPLGALDVGAAALLRDLMATMLRPGVDVVFDLSQVDHIDAAGATALLGSVRRVRAMGSRSRLRHVNPRIRWILDLIGVDRFLTDTPWPDRPERADARVLAAAVSA